MRATFGVVIQQVEGKLLYIAWATRGERALSATGRTYTEAREALAVLAKRRRWALHYFDGERVAS